MSNPEEIVFKGVTYRRPPYYVTSTGKKKLHVAIWEDTHGPVPRGHHIHHKDGNPFNNDISNLVCLSASEHASFNGRHERRRVEATCLNCGKTFLKAVGGKEGMFCCKNCGYKYRLSHPKDGREYQKSTNDCYLIATSPISLEEGKE